MKAYQVRIELDQSSPLVWRKVILPEGATFARLHQVIQNSLSFSDCHLYMFSLPGHQLRVTNDNQAHQVYQEYRENQEQIEQTLTALGTSFARLQLEQMRTVVRSPEQTAVDEYLLEEGLLHYVYDLRHRWEITVTLEQIVENYALAYPTLLAGEEAAPHDSMRGLAGFREFLDAYRDPGHPDHALACTWAKQQAFRYDHSEIQRRLRALAE